MCFWIMAGLVLGGFMSYALRPVPPFNFLRGHRLVRTEDHFDAYELFGDSTELSRKVESELAGLRFKRITEERWPRGRKVEYRSADEETRVFLVSVSDQAQPVSFWIVPVQKQLRLRTFLSDVRSVLTLTRHHCFSPVNACIANMKQIEGAQETWALENPKRTNEIPSDADLFGPHAYIRVKPECPEGGRYIRGYIGEHPHCSVPWHSLE